eukprot:scaffold6012_cov127-Cylindrotheca_fusiformis.AAC.3
MDQALPYISRPDIWLRNLDGIEDLNVESELWFKESENVDDLAFKKEDNCGGTPKKVPYPEGRTLGDKVGPVDWFVCLRCFVHNLPLWREAHAVNDLNPDHASPSKFLCGRLFVGWRMGNGSPFPTTWYQALPYYISRPDIWLRNDLDGIEDLNVESELWFKESENVDDLGLPSKRKIIAEAVIFYILHIAKFIASMHGDGIIHGDVRGLKTCWHPYPEHKLGKKRFGRPGENLEKSNEVGSAMGFYLNYGGVLDNSFALECRNSLVCPLQLCCGNMNGGDAAMKIERNAGANYKPWLFHSETWSIRRFHAHDYSQTVGI